MDIGYATPLPPRKHRVIIGVIKVIYELKELSGGAVKVAKILVVRKIWSYMSPNTRHIGVFYRLTGQIGMNIF